MGKSAHSKTPCTGSARWLPVLVALLLLPDCGPPAPRRPNVVIYLIDTLRRDHLSAYGYERDTSPRLKAFAGDAITFENAYATSAWTKASTASLLTGMYPLRHGATTRNSRLKQDARLIGDYLEPLGYYRMGVVANPFVVGHWGFDQGYDVFHDQGESLASPSDWLHINAESMHRKAFELLDGRPADQPFFLYVHTIDVHGPNTPLPPFDRLYSSDPKPPGHPGRLTGSSPARRVRETIDLYDGEINFADEHFGIFLDQLRERGLYDDSVIWFVSDHGEEFLDHGRGGHGTQLFDEVVKIPMMLKLSGNEHAGATVEAPVSLVDVLTTQLQLVDQTPPADLPGIDLSTLVGKRWESRPMFLDLNLIAGPAQQLYVSSGVILDRYKYFEELLPQAQKYLYDLHADPDEQVNLVLDDAATAASLSKILQLHRSTEISGLVLTALGQKRPEERLLRLRLRTDGMFRNVNPLDLEADDQVRLHEDGKRLELDFILKGDWSNVTKNVLRQDFDTVVLRLEPSDARVTLESALVDGDATVPIFLGLERIEAEAPQVFSSAMTSLLAPDLSAMFSKAERNPMAPLNAPATPPGLYVVQLPGPSLGDDDIPAEMLARLRALGYVK